MSAAIERERSKKPSNGGFAVDARGNPVVDPTANVLSLVEAAVQRLNDLQAAETRLNEGMRLAESRRVDELRLAEQRRVDELMTLRAEYAERLAVAEAKRIDAIRAVDVSAVAVASQRASDQAAVLATQVATSAEALRALVATTAATVAQSQQQLATTLSTRLTTLEQAQYEGKGKQAIADPAMVELMQEVKTLRIASTMGAGASQGGKAVKEESRLNIGIIVGVGGLLLAIVGTIVAVFSRLP